MVVTFISNVDKLFRNSSFLAGEKQDEEVLLIPICPHYSYSSILSNQNKYHYPGKLLMGSKKPDLKPGDNAIF